MAEGFYPSDKKQLEETLEKLFSKTKAESANVQAAVVPHAGYSYSGHTAAMVYSLIKNKYDSVIILGTNHTGVGERVAVSMDNWDTPLGVVENDVKLGKKIAELCEVCHEDELAHMYEHSIEVQLPFLQHRLGEFRVVPIGVSSGFSSLEAFRKIGSAIKKATEGMDVLVIASSDFTHFGKMYQFEPVKRNVIEWVKKTDKEIINAIISKNPAKVVELAGNSTVCGYAGIAVLLFSLKNGTEGKLVDYSTSYDISKNKDAIVGYGGIAFV